MPLHNLIHGCLRERGGSMLLPQIKQTIGLGVNAWSVQVNQTMCSIRTDHAIQDISSAFFVQVVLLLFIWSILCVGMKEVYLSFNYNDIRWKIRK